MNHHTARYLIGDAHLPLSFLSGANVIEELGALVDDSAVASADEGRVLFLSGDWQKPGSVFKFEAVVLLQPDGAADGVIQWQNVRTARVSPSFVATEFVEGTLHNQNLDLMGCRAEPGLATDHYKIALIGGGPNGAFGGKSRAFGDWSGRMRGTYLFASVERT